MFITAAGSEPALTAETGREGTAKHKGHCLPRGLESRGAEAARPDGVEAGWHGGWMAWRLDGVKAG